MAKLKMQTKCALGECPTIIKTDNDTYIIIGAIVKQADYEELKDRIGSDETAIEIDAEFLENAVFVESR